ncbi:lipopolysaccharide export system permease protein [Algoriphagus alkaliphilus]|uniref:Lipopolysaccharide export system permease protein n=1 Tax=Algoriphagus alkaliphilus TaxID=279824 RepID=A0A1G5Z601_9BACT|nr:LptF/LptG family permease [Algoriphagus alkaliphilus]SDA90017.1 lipopolysaccharide export system permease protein [Algoriphagus alkaliphilus]
MKKLDKLILGSFLGPFLLTFLVVDFILLIVNMLKYFDEIFGKGLGFWIYVELIGYFVISISPMALPLAVLLSSLMTFGNLGEHFELTAIKSSGISLIRAMRPIGIFAILLTIAAYLSNNYLVPKVNLKTFSLLYDIRMKSPALDIKEGVFYSGIPGYSIKVNEKKDDIRLRDIIIYNHADQQGNLNVTLADSGRMETFFNDSYLKLTLYQGHNYKEARATRGINEAPVEFSRTKFEENVIVFDLDAFQLSRTPEDLWSTNRAIKNIAQIKDGLDSIYSLINDLKFQNYQTAESIYPFFTRNRKLTPPEFIKERKIKDDEARRVIIEQEKKVRDSLDNIKSSPSDFKVIDTLSNRELKINVATTSENQRLDTIFKRKRGRNLTVNDSSSQQSTLITTVDTLGIGAPKKIIRTTPLTATEKELIDSVVFRRGYMSNALTMALNNSRNLKNTFNVKMSQVDNHEREFRRYEIAWYQKYTQAIACFVMFLIGAPLGSIIKKGGLGLPVLISIIFFIMFYMLTITGEKWAKEGVTDSLFGTVFSNLCLIPFGLFFLRQARKDARLFEGDFYSGIWKRIRGFLYKSPAKSN